MGKPTWNDLKEATPKELMRVYKLDQRGLENAHRKHLDGANATERRTEYDQLYRKNRSDNR
jgi:hypothetical protein